MGWADVIKSSVVSLAGKGIVKGMVIRLCAGWTIEQLKDCAAKNYGLADLLKTRHPVGATITRAARNSMDLRNLEPQEILGWIKQGNPGLYEHILESPEVIRWFRQVWKQDKEKLLVGP